jgi:glycosyltransferase involved in cell wall biosynthesis
MNVLLLHQNFPGQFVHLARALVQRRARVVAIGGPTARALQGIEFVRYKYEGREPPVANRLSHRFMLDCLRGDLVAQSMLNLRKRGFVPDLVIGHPGWGEALFVKDIFPDARVVTYCEFFYKSHGADINFDPEFEQTDERVFRLMRTRNASMALSLLASDRGLSPTLWQRSVHPPPLAERIAVIHDGIDTAAARPDPSAHLSLPDGRRLTAGQEVVTYVARNLEPYRGFHIFMRALPEILARRPNAQIVIVGGDGISYGKAPNTHKNWREAMLQEVGSQLDRSRVHFLGSVIKATFLLAMQVSACHVYLTYPFVLSWSMLEAMACGCPVVASATPPVLDVVRDHDNGLLFDFFDVKALADRVVNVLAEPHSYSGLRAAARSTIVASYDLHSHCLPRQLALLGEILGDESLYRAAR